MQDPRVSISCITYNHEAYIKDALDGFLMQKTNFIYEILIHDDASTDRTAEFIREYEKKYPDRIKPVYQTVNQYSQKKKVSAFNIQRAKGKYLAICEGDDFWTDPFKLQKQVDFMEANPDCSLCLHGASTVSAKKEHIGYVAPSKISRFFTPDEVIWGGGGMFATNSMFYRTELEKSKPKFFDELSVGDYPQAIYLSLQGKVYYFAEILSAYRIGIPGSWTMRQVDNVERIEFHTNEITRLLDQVNEYSAFRYEDAIKKRMLSNELQLLIDMGNYSVIRRPKYKTIYKTLPLKRRIRIRLKQHFPALYMKAKKFTLYAKPQRDM